MIANEPTISKGCVTLRDAFTQAKQHAEEHEAGMCWLDPFGIGVPTFVVMEDDEWEEWIESPNAMIDQSGHIAINLKDILSNERVLEALLNATKSD